MQKKTRLQLFWKQRMIFFAEKEHLTKPSRGIFLSDKITEHGKYMDNRETWRRCISGNDCVILRLALCEEIRKLEVDTIFFKGNLSESLFNRISKLSCWFLTKKTRKLQKSSGKLYFRSKNSKPIKDIFLIGKNPLEQSPACTSIFFMMSDWIVFLFWA